VRPVQRFTDFLTFKLKTMKATALQNTIYYCTWNGNRQPLAIDRATVSNFIQGAIVDPRIKLDQFKVYSSFGELQLTIFIQGTDKTI
jgi:hypothetical protein